MITHFIEVTNNEKNWGKFLLIRFDEFDAKYQSVFSGRSLLASIGWNKQQIIVFDLQTQEGAGFRPGGYVKADIQKHKIWVCPMFEPFLEWLYKQDLTDITKLPPSVNLPDAEFALFGYRREGKHE